MRLRAFQGLRPTPGAVERVASRPYDVVTTEEARAVAESNPQSLMRVIRAEVDFPPGTDPHADAVYHRARENFERLQAEGLLIREDGPVVYLYRLQSYDHTQIGIAALCHVADYDNGTIKKHENTRPEKEADRTRLTSELSANTGPIFMTYRDVPDIDQLAAGITTGPPLFDFSSDEDVRHTVWRVPGGQTFLDAFRSVSKIYVADGHHRTASAARVARERRAANPKHTGVEDYNWFLCVHFPASQLRILAYNRVVKDLNGLTPAGFLEAVGRVCHVEPTSDPHPRQPLEVCLYLEGRWHRLTFEPLHEPDPVASLDMSILQEKILAPILGIENQSTSDRIDFVGGIRGTDHLASQVDSGAAAAAFSLNAVTVDQLMAIADSGRNMPTKTTWFEPKLASGLFIHTF